MTKIIADSTCDLSKELVEKYNIEILPLHILLGEEEFLDGVNISPAEIYAWSDANKATPKTSAIDMNTPVEVFRKYVNEGCEVVCFCISDDMSTTGNILRMAVDELEAQEKVKIVNSANLSTGIGLMVIEAAIMAQAGECAAVIAERMEKIKPLVRASFVVDTLVYLHRGGRCNGIAALAGGALKLHPRIAVEDGKMKPGKKYRGNINKAIIDYAKDMEADLKTAKKDRVFITHSGCDKEVVEEVRAYLTSLNHFDEILETVAGSVISSHCGPGTLGVLFIDGK